MSPASRLAAITATALTAILAATLTGPATALAASAAPAHPILVAPVAAKAAAESQSAQAATASSHKKKVAKKSGPAKARAIAKAMVKHRGWSTSQYQCLVKLWNRESGWRTTAGGVYRSYGIPQANPGTKMASAGRGWRTDATTQIRWGLGYIKGRYGTPCGAWGHSQATGWY